MKEETGNSSEYTLSRYRWAFFFVPLALFFFIVTVSRQSIEFERNGFSLGETIGRANRVIAIDDPEDSLYRWVFSTPSDYIQVTENGNIPKHEAASISYGTGWTRPKQELSETIWTDLSDEEWFLVEQWRTSWCSEAPSFGPPANNTPVFAIAMRCHGYSATLYRAGIENIPPHIFELLRRSASSVGNRP